MLRLARGVALLVGLLLGCGSAPSGGTVASVGYARDIQPIWDRYCVRCHGLQSPQLGAPRSRDNLNAASRFSECVPAPFVVAGHPEGSFLYFKLTGTTDLVLPASCGRLMPAQWDASGDVPLVRIDPDAVTLVRQWILEGAASD